MFIELTCKTNDYFCIQLLNSIFGDGLSPAIKKYYSAMLTSKSGLTWHGHVAILLVRGMALQTEVSSPSHCLDLMEIHLVNFPDGINLHNH